MSNNSLKQLISQIEALPSAPSLYAELNDVLKKPNVGIGEVAEVISKDAGMSAKVLQLVNSSFFGARQRESNPTIATALLGLKTIRSLVVSEAVFANYNVSDTVPFDVEEIAGHNIAVSVVSRAIAALESSDSTITDDAAAAGLLHDAGKIILAANLPEQYNECIEFMRKERVSVWIAEKEIFKATHADVGAYLLGIWGLPSPVVEAVALHHSLDTYDQQGSVVARAVYFAEILCHECKLQDASIDPSKIAESYRVKRTQMGF
jgi:HD-like signal output (HDOD) protein